MSGGTVWWTIKKALWWLDGKTRCPVWLSPEEDADRSDSALW